MSDSIIVTISPRYLLRGSLDIVSILKLIGLKSIILAGPSDNIKVELPSGTKYSEVAWSKALNTWFYNVPSFLSYLIEQVLVAFTLIRQSKKARLVLFSHSLMPFPVVVSKILRKKTLLYSGGLFHTTVPTQYPITRALVLLLESLYYKWADAILVVTSSLANDAVLEKHRAKIFEASARLLDKNFFARFSFSRPSIRRNVIGFIGRSSWEKGASDFAASIPLVRVGKKDAKFLIVGSDSTQFARSDVLEMSKIDPSLMEKCVEMISWVNDIESYLKKMKLLVIPSKSEGMPSVLLEAAACGTLVLATPVGGIGDFIVDGQTGFLLDNTSPDTIAHRILEILGSQSLLLDRVSLNAYRLLKQKYDADQVLSAWRLAIENTLHT